MGQFIVAKIVSGNVFLRGW